ncbi:HelD family protein [Mobilicoccus massiliensis]|uniref:HelD family protein n=1 Tax=Mobilicoccus massiliensis TaxID=1522310 RepID=UPI00058F80C0|nr:AAA family ATPase [Mobilicoccus massiliensis]
MTDEREHGQADAGDVLARELAHEQAHVDRVYDELRKAGERAALVEAEGLARGRTDRTGDIRDEEMSGLFARDALVFRAGQRRHDLERQHEGLVFGRLDLEDSHGREVRYVGRLGVRDDDYEPLVIDWRAPAASAFYRATPVDPQNVLRRRVLRCRGDRVVGAEDDLMVNDAPDDLVVLGEGALMAALGRSRSARMRDIVATIQAHQDEAIRAPARGVTEITGGPGTGKTVVALHRAAYLLYSDRRRFEGGGVLVVGPSAAYTAYIERVLPSLGEESVSLRALGDVVEACTAGRVDPPAAAAVKGSLRVRRVLARASRDTIPGAPRTLRAMVAGRPVRLESRRLDRVRAQVLRRHHRNSSQDAMTMALAADAWSQVRRPEDGDTDREEFIATFVDHRDVEAFLHEWWRPVDPREVLLWLADSDRTRRYARGVLTLDEAEVLAESLRTTLDTGTWSVADVALVDDLDARLGEVKEVPVERGFFEIEELDELEAQRSLRIGVPERDVPTHTALAPTRRVSHGDARDLLLRGHVDPPSEYAHVLVDEAQDVSPMQWRMLARRGRWASWTVVGDLAQASWEDHAEAAEAREAAFGTAPRRSFHMSTNYRNAREVFEYAEKVIREHVPDADIPDAVRETGVEPVDRTVPAAELAAAVRESVDALASEVDGSIAVIAPARWAGEMAALVTEMAGGEGVGDRLVLVDPLSTKGLEYDATVVVDPDEIVAESPGGVRVLYVVLTRAAHRMHVLRPA